MVNGVWQEFKVIIIASSGEYPIDISQGKFFMLFACRLLRCVLLLFHLIYGLPKRAVTRRGKYSAAG